jgi:hypothetical protein
LLERSRRAVAGDLERDGQRGKPGNRRGRKLNGIIHAKKAKYHGGGLLLVQFTGFNVIASKSTP